MIKEKRIVLIDALRGMAISCILLIHHIEHFDFYKKPIYTLKWLINIDKWVWDKLFLLVAGKAFALFSLLFGLSYWIIHENRKRKEESYFLRHFWRMFLLAIIGIFHLCFFRGDILIMYAVLGLPLVISPYLNKKWVLFLSIGLLINPIYAFSVGHYVLNSSIFDFRLSFPKVNMNEHLMQDSFWELLKINVTKGFQGTLIWSWNVGRFSTILGLFFLGTYFGRIKVLTHKSLKFWYYFLIVSIVGWLTLDLLNDVWINHIIDKKSKQILNSIIQTYTRLCMMFSILSLIVVLWKHNGGNVWLRRFSDFGRLGLTNYVLMSVIGSILYYGWGFGLYKYCGSLFSLCIGIVVLMFQMKLSSWWLHKYNQGPLEKLWRKLTWLEI